MEKKNPKEQLLSLTPLHSERSKLHRVLAFQSATGQRIDRRLKELFVLESKRGVKEAISLCKYG